jgi:hypothetical protein
MKFLKRDAVFVGPKEEGASLGFSDVILFKNGLLSLGAALELL